MGGIEVFVEKAIECVEIAQRREKLAADGGPEETMHRIVSEFARERADRFARLAGWPNASSLELDRAVGSARCNALPDR